MATTGRGTTRLLPWMLAAFIAMLFLVPFDQVKVNAQLPIDLSFDRLVLPFIVGTWAVALIVGGRVAPRLRVTWIHVAIGAFVVCAFVSVILGAHELTNTLELDRAFKQLPLLVAYVSLFVVVASTVRRTEVRAFLTYTLVLAGVCALGMLFEYRFKQNPFYDLSDTLLPGFFSVDYFDAGAVDDIGRLKVSGPTAVPLEAVATLAMALPIAIVGLIHAPRWRSRLLYALAAGLLMAATLATYRKSGLLAPISVVLTVAYFRRRELLKLAPLGLVLVVFVHVLAPGAIGSTTDQFDPSRLGVATVSDRAADYDAVRPDIWTHAIFGRGWGTYDHVDLSHTRLGAAAPNHRDGSAGPARLRRHGSGGRAVRSRDDCRPRSPLVSPGADRCGRSGLLPRGVGAVRRSFVSPSHLHLHADGRPGRGCHLEAISRRRATSRASRTTEAADLQLATNESVRSAGACSLRASSVIRSLAGDDLRENSIRCHVHNPEP